MSHLRTERTDGDGPLIEEGSAFLRLAPRPAPAEPAERFDVLVIGAGQAGLSVGYYLAGTGLRFLIVDGNPRIGHAWRNRWDSLRLFTPARYDGLAGMPFPGPPHSFPTKDEMADYLESYAKRFSLPVRTGIRIDRLWREDGRYVATAEGPDSKRFRFEAAQVVVAMATYQKPRVPEFARALDPGIAQLHSSEYRRPEQLRAGAVLIAGAGNSGAEIAIEVARSHETWMAGRDTGAIPFRVESRAARLFLLPLVFRFLFHRVLTRDNALGRKARQGVISKGGPLIRVKRRQLAAAGVKRVPRVAGVRDGRPFLADGRVLDVGNVIWSTGFHTGFSWIELDLPGGKEEPEQTRGVVAGHPGLYFVGLHFQYAFSSTMIHGVARDAEFVAAAVARRAKAVPARAAAAV
ncbi:MAG TPA: FAD-dependent oxidoreductase [Thermoanaerobaculia bacterium]|jgi:putative flavoprotein involved in K+ transport